MWFGFFVLSAAATLSFASLTHIDGDGIATTDMACPNGGYYTNPQDCSVYYKCIYSNRLGIYIPRRYVCKHGTVFSKLRYNRCVKLSKSGRRECEIYQPQWIEAKKYAKKIRIIDEVE